MANKRFLGLGFTFSATDKGLEKKLKGISSALSSITESLESISKAGPSAGSAMGGMGDFKKGKKKKPSEAGSADQLSFAFMKKKKKPSEAGGAERSADDSEKEQTKKKKKKKTYKGSYEDMARLFSKESKDSLEKIFAVFSKGGAKHLQETMKDVTIEVDKHGNITQDSMQSILKSALNFAKGGSEVSLLLTKARVALDKFKDWFKSVASSADTFLKTMGIDLSSIIPEQFKAALGVFKSILAPILNAPKELFKFFAGRKTGKQSSKQADAIYKMLDAVMGIKEQIGGDKTNTVVGSIDEANKEKDKGNIFSRMLKGLGGLIGKIPLIGPLLVSFATALSGVTLNLSPLARLSLQVAGRLGLVAVATAATIGALQGLSEAVKDTGGWKSFWDKLGRFDQALGAWVSTVLKAGTDWYLSIMKGADDWVAGIAAKSGEAGQKIFDGIIKVLNVAWDFLETITSPSKLLGMVKSGSKDLMYQGATKFIKSLDPMSEALENSAKKMQETQPAPVVQRNYGQNMDESNRGQAKRDAEQAALMKQNNEILERIAASSENQKSTSVAATFKNTLKGMDPWQQQQQQYREASYSGATK